MTMNLIKRSKLAVAAVLVAASLANVAQAGRRGGPGYTQTTVAAFSSDRFCIDFRGGERARIVADGDGDTDLDLFVYDDCGRLVAADDDGTDFCVVEFWVPRGQSYTVVIRNLGGVCNVYTLGTN